MTIVVMLSKNLWHERELQLCFLAHSLAMFLLHAEICLRPRMSLGCGVIFLTQEAMILLCHDTFARCKLLYTSCETERRVYRPCDLILRKGTQNKDFRSGGDTTSTSSLFHPIHCVPQFCTTSPEPTQRQNYPIQAWRKASQLKL